MPQLPITDETLRQAADVLLRGGLVAFPTETVYGLGGDAFNPSALAKIFETKKRPRFDPLIIHIAAMDTLEIIGDLSVLNTAERKILDKVTGEFWPGPLTVILPKQKAVPGLATGGLQTVAVRYPAHDAAQRLIELSSGAIAAPSANPFGYLSPTTARHVADALGENVDIILDGGSTHIGLESTVLDICQGQPRVLRPGGTSKESIEAIIGEVSSGSVDKVLSPGMLPSHYAPKIPLTVFDRRTLSSIPGDKTKAILFFDGDSRDTWLAGRLPDNNAFPLAVLSNTGDLREAAAKLFETLHDMEKFDVRQIYAQFAPEHGLGIAINDRLRRASSVKP
ncbi:MAG: L-threonylcarbamoyladenylate synthase [Treponema sp.]|nr:L-threonylcarbamoyladenylate synthase [Treponema sp.]